MILECDSPHHALLDCAVEACLPVAGETWNYSWRLTPLLILKVDRRSARIYYDDPSRRDVVERMFRHVPETHFSFDYWFELLGNGVLHLETDPWHQRKMPPQLR